MDLYPQYLKNTLDFHSKQKLQYRKAIPLKTSNALDKVNSNSFGENGNIVDVLRVR